MSTSLGSNDSVAQLLTFRAACPYWKQGWALARLANSYRMKEVQASTAARSNLNYVLTLRTPHRWAVPTSKRIRSDAEHNFDLIY
jgi:hypothetical protein